MNTYVNYRAKIKHILSFSPWHRLPNRQSRVDLQSFLSALIIWTHRGNMQQNLSLFHYLKVNRRRRLAGRGDYYQLFPPQPSISFLQPKRQERKAGSVATRLNVGSSWLAFHTAVGSGRSSSLSLFPTMQSEGINKRVHRLALTAAGTTQQHPSPWPKYPEPRFLRMEQGMLTCPQPQHVPYLHSGWQTTSASPRLSEITTYYNYFISETWKKESEH